MPNVPNTAELGLGRSEPNQKDITIILPKEHNNKIATKNTLLYPERKASLNLIRKASLSVVNTGTHN